MSYKIHLAHLGCAKNMVDSEIHLSNFTRLGFEATEEAEEADLIVVNTCGFIKSAKEQSIDTIFEHTSTGKAKVVVTGCLYQRYKDMSEAMPEVNGWLKGNNLDEVTSLVKDLGFKIPPKGHIADTYDRVLLEKSSHAYLRISEGCNKSCSFCSIPKFKGKMVSRTIESLVTEARLLLDKGIRELNIVSQDTCNYGTDIYGGSKGGMHLKSLLQQLVQLDVTRIRLLYLYPLWLDPSFFEFMAQEPKICNYIDMPLQHASAPILKAMKRPGNAEVYLKELARIRSIFPQVALRSTFIVGFPGETEAQFQELKDFVAEARFDWMGAFTYSKEESTTSFALQDDVHHKTKLKRQRELTRLYEEKRAELPTRVGQEVELILEEKSEGLWIGRSQFEAPEVDGVIYLDRPQGYLGEVVRAKIASETDFDCEATAIH